MRVSVAIRSVQEKCAADELNGSSGAEQRSLSVTLGISLCPMSVEPGATDKSAFENEITVVVHWSKDSILLFFLAGFLVTARGQLHAVAPI